MIKSRKSFTLIELLVVLAIVAILSTVVIMTLNPAELLKQARDSTRLSDLSTLNTALAAYSADVTGGFMGTSSVVYVSIPDTTSTCANIGLPTLPTGWNYNCVTSTSTKLSNGSGWIPVNFANISFGSPLSSLPVDPVNTTSSGNYYTYVSGGSFQLSSKLESLKYQPQAILTNTYDPALYVAGNNTNLAPFVGGLVGLWDFEEGAGTSSADASGYNKTSQMYSHASLVDLHTSVGCKSGSCVSFATASSSMGVSSSTAWNFGSGSFTLSAWINVPASTYGIIFEHNFNNAFGGLWVFRKNSSGEKPSFYMYDDSGQARGCSYGVFSFGSWQHVTLVMNKYAAGSIIYYLNGVQVCSASISVTQNGAPNSGFYVGGDYEAQSQYIQNLVVDGLRIYGRALSAAEVAALYNSTK